MTTDHGDLREELLRQDVALQYCPNGECVNFRCEVDTNSLRCVMCAWGLVLVKKHADRGCDHGLTQNDQAARRHE